MQYLTHTYLLLTDNKQAKRSKIYLKINKNFIICLGMFLGNYPAIQIQVCLLFSFKKII